MLKKATLAAAVVMGLGSTGAQATVFTMTYMNFPGANNFDVTGTVDSSTGTGAFNSGGTPFFIAEWTATVTGTFNTADGASGASGINGTTWGSTVGTGASASATYNFTLAPGQTAMSLLFDWSTSMGIPVLNIVNGDGTGVDIDGDTVLGTKMAAGPFINASVGFAGTTATVPVPAAAWLLGSGLVGLAGIARRKAS